GAAWAGGADRWEVNLHGATQRFHNANARVNADRTVEARVLRQTIPVTSAGGSGVWTRRLSGASRLTAGLDLRWVAATNEETVFDGDGSPAGTRAAGGAQATAGLFAEWELRPLEALTISAGLRADG